MKPEDGAIVVGMPREAGILGDDRYLVEMTERLQKLRSLVGEQEKPKSSKKRWLNRHTFNGVM